MSVQGEASPGPHLGQGPAYGAQGLEERSGDQMIKISCSMSHPETHCTIFTAGEISGFTLTDPFWSKRVASCLTHDEGQDVTSMVSGRPLSCSQRQLCNRCPWSSMLRGKPVTWSPRPAC